MLERISQVTSSDIRNFVLWLEVTVHNFCGRHVAYRALKTFFRWYDLEAETENWRNPIAKVKVPRLVEEQLEPVEMENVRLMLITFDTYFHGRRNRAGILFLLDRGLRAGELLSIKLEDVNLITGGVLLRKGEGR